YYYSLHPDERPTQSFSLDKDGKARRCDGLPGRHYKSYQEWRLDQFVIYNRKDPRVWGLDVALTFYRELWAEIAESQGSNWKEKLERLKQMAQDAKEIGEI